MSLSPRHLIGWIIFLFFLEGCSASLSNQFEKTENRPHEAEHFFKLLDESVVQTGVTHAAYAKIEGFPYLRTSRFLAALKNTLETDPQRLEWVEELRRLDLESRKKEINNLPEAEIVNLYNQVGQNNILSKDDLYRLLEEHSESMFIYDRNREGYYRVLMEVVDVPEEYSTAMRVFGLYPLAYLPVAYATDSAYNKMRKWHKTPIGELKQYGKIIGYSSEKSASRPPVDIKKLFSPAIRNQLGMPRLTASDKAKLARFFAPVVLQDTVEYYDVIGTLEWQNGVPSLNVEKPSVYYYLTFALLKNQPILQINYSFWYAARKGERAPWIEHGNIDGLTYRVTLDSKGSPFMVDAMNNCGCYHFFIPDQKRVEAVLPLDFEFDALVLKWLPEVFPSKPINLRISAGWHQVENLDVYPVARKTKQYSLVPYDELESLKGLNGQNHSIFNSEGILKNTERIEPYLLFSMGVPDIGSMRQRGHHPIKLIGKAHFDDPNLFNTHFEFKETAD